MRPRLPPRYCAAQQQWQPGFDAAGEAIRADAGAAGVHDAEWLPKSEVRRRIARALCSQRRAVQVAIALDSMPSTRRLVCSMAWKLTLTQTLLDPRSAMATRLVVVRAAVLAVAIRATPSPRDSPLWRYAPRGRRAGTAAARRPFRPSPRTGFVRRRTCASHAAVATGRAAPRAAPPTQPRRSSPRPASRVVRRDSPTKTRFIKGVVS